MIRTLRGFVGDTTARPLVGAKVEVLDGPDAGSFAAANDSGWFTLIGALADTTRLRVTKDGHVTATGTIAYWRRDGPTDYVSIALAVAATFLWANIRGVSFLANQSRIPILIAGDVVTFWLGEHGYGAFFVEQVAPNTYLQFDGGATVSASQSPVTSLSTTFEGAVDYCVMRSPMTGLYYDCDRSRAVTNVHCVSNKHQLILTRQ